jgi:uncharacterized membrane protein
VESRRAESFSDGVFAVAITVLVFNLLPIARPGLASYRALLSYWPQYAAYAVSFLTIGIMWLNHHTVLSYVAKVDRVTLVLNVLLLMGVVAVPFPTALIADSLSKGAAPDAARIAAVAYGVLLTATSIAFSGMWNYLAAHQRTLALRPIRTPRSATIRFSAGLAGYVAGTVVAAFGLADVALVMYAAIAVYYLFEHLPESAMEAAADPETEPDGDESG